MWGVALYAIKYDCTALFGSFLFATAVCINFTKVLTKISANPLAYADSGVVNLWVNPMF